MDNDNAKKIAASLNNLNKIMSLFLVIAFDGSTFKSKTNDEIKKVMPKFLLVGILYFILNNTNNQKRI